MLLSKGDTKTQQLHGLQVGSQKVVDNRHSLLRFACRVESDGVNVGTATI